MLTPFEILHEAEITIVLSVGGWIVFFPIRTFFKNLTGKWESLTTKVDAVQEELVKQRTNCLATLQSQGVDQVKLLTDVAGTLKQMHESQIEMTGYFKGRGDR